MQIINNDSLNLIMTLLKLQNHDKKICDLFITNHDCTFGELKIEKSRVARPDGWEFRKDDHAVFRWWTEETWNCIVLWSKNDAIGRFVELDEILKHVSFEDKV